MLLKFVLLSMLAMHVNYTKENDRFNDAPAELLTKQDWLLENYGYDKNKNGGIDASEVSIADCELDNTYNFKPNGTGIYLDNAISCGNGISEQSFTWKFSNNELSLNFSFRIARVLCLTENKLIISETTPGQTVNFITVFRR